MSDIATAKLFRLGSSQAVRLPEAFRLPGREVRITHHGDGVLLEPIAETAADVDPDDAYFDAIFATIDSASDEDFMPEGRQQPPMPDGTHINLDE